MKRLITMCAVVGLMLNTMALADTVPVVNHPPGEDPDWWNVECIYYAYGWWEDLADDGCDVSPSLDDAHWASGFLSNTDFTANWGSVDSNTITIDLDNIYDEDLYKEIYIYLEGTTASTIGNVSHGIDTDAGTFNPSHFEQSIVENEWYFAAYGEIHPQPDYVTLTVTVPGLTGVTDIWAGENCIPEPATVCLLGLGALSLIRRRKA